MACQFNSAYSAARTMKQDASSNQRQPLQDSTAGRKAGGVPPPGSIPDHELVCPIGEGSYGDVWLARNMMGMYRAVKIVYSRSFLNQRPFERELSGIRKFEPISRSHEGFVDVLHVGSNEEQECFYYVMELGDDQVSGQTIDPDHYSTKALGKEISLRGRLPFQDCLHLGLALSQALSELHKHGLVHRDVKPSNIIFVNGVPKLADIGLVAALKGLIRMSARKVLFRRKDRALRRSISMACARSCTKSAGGTIATNCLSCL